MKVLMLGSWDSGGGAAIAANRLCNAMIKYGIDASLFVEKKKTDADYVCVLPKKKLYYLHAAGRVMENRLIRKLTKTTNKILHTVNCVTVSDISWINDSDYDVVHLHWINGTVSTSDIAKINKPIVWTLHDSWPCCGAEHHPNLIENDTRWKDGYTKDNKPDTTKGVDICKKVWEQKRRLLKDKNIIFVAPSDWERDILKKSALFGDSECFVIPNPLPYSIFHTHDKMNERRLRGIPTDKMVIGFGAANQMDSPDSMKGTSYLIEALNRLGKKDRCFILLFGPAQDGFTRHLPVPFYSSGYTSDPDEMACLYSCCDCFVNSSLIENLSNTVFESIACHTPVTAFDVGGTSDLVTHKFNGYLAKPYDPDDLTRGIEFCLENNKSLSDNCAELSEKITEKRIVEDYLKVYSLALKS